MELIINDKSAFHFHKLLLANDNDNIKKMIETLTINTILLSKHNGFISNFITYLINNNQLEDNIEKIERLNIMLMKRDYLQLINYYYYNNNIKAIDIFVNNVIPFNNFMSKDIDYIINNKLYKLLGFLDGLFIKSNIINDNNININILKLKYLSDDITNDILDILKSKIGHLDKIIIRRKINVIIDGCNVIHFNNGLITKTSFNDLKNIIIQSRETFGEPLVIIHSRHIKTIPKLIDLFNLLNVAYYLTPPNFDDDLFILNYFLEQKTKLFIISNDKYRDHIFKYSLLDKSTNSMCQFKNIISQQTISYKYSNDNDFIFSNKPTYSECIQVIDNIVYVPTTKSFIEIPLV
jgi:hypothetical protein